MLSKLNVNLSENAKYGAFFAIALLLCAAVFVLIIRPLQNDRATIATQILQANTRLAKLQTFASQNQDYDSLLKIQKLKLEQAKKKLPDTVALPELIAEFTKLSDANGISLTSIVPLQSVKVGTAYGLPVNMTLSGDFFRMVNFLQQVENGDRFVTLQGTKFTVEQDGNLEMTANFLFYATKPLGGKDAKADGQKKGANSGFKEAKEAKTARDAQVEQVKAGK